MKSLKWFACSFIKSIRISSDSFFDFVCKLQKPVMTSGRMVVVISTRSSSVISTCLISCSSSSWSLSLSSFTSSSASMLSVSFFGFLILFRKSLSMMSFCFCWLWLNAYPVSFENSSLSSAYVDISKLLRIIARILNAFFCVIFDFEIESAKLTINVQCAFESLILSIRQMMISILRRILFLVSSLSTLFTDLLLASVSIWPSAEPSPVSNSVNSCTIFVSSLKNKS
mmetsp:Transcript_1286/g.1366  ORF Transcript_1286/g.1366 Transcript_1286/m.1366 type:complete len:227 (-) Transcript_1286:1032-1712(-)